jgi:betaine-aldehyde dehydrogenase
MPTTTSQPARLGELKNFVNGEFTATADGRSSDIIDPSTGEAYARAPVSGAADVDAALTCAEAAREGRPST